MDAWNLSANEMNPILVFQQVVKIHKVLGGVDGNRRAGDAVFNPPGQLFLRYDSELLPVRCAC